MSFLTATHLVRVPDFPSQLNLLVVEVGPGEDLLARLALPLSLGHDGLSAGHGHLHVVNHFLLLLHQLCVLDLGGAGRRG
jgi:hypothetical protein